jgi:hypothetical protein
LFPGAFKDGRSAYRWAEEHARRWADEKMALLIKYRIAGSAHGPKKTALVDGVAAIEELGPVSEWELVDHDHNTWAVALRELRDMIRAERGLLADSEGEPLFFDDGRPDDHEVDFGVGQTVTIGELRRWLRR